MKPITVFFDVGGTLVDAPDLIGHIAATLTGGEPDKVTYDLFLTLFMETYRSHTGDNAYLSIEKVITGTLTVIANRYGYPDISGRAYELYADVFLHNSRLFPETLPVLETLLRNDVQMVIASDADTGLLEKELDKHKLGKYFCDRCISGSVQAYKPAEEFIRHLRKYTREREENCYFVGDNDVDVESGRRLGIKSVLINRKDRGNKANADYVIHDLNRLLAILDIM